MANYQYESVLVDMIGSVAHVQLNRPKKLNAFNDSLICNVRNVFQTLSYDQNVRAVVVSGSGRMFTAGLDLTENILDLATADADPARNAYAKRPHIQDFQAAFTAIEECAKPVIAAVHNGCFGAGVDLVTACDIRYCSKDAYFSVKEVDIGLAADVGTLQRLPKVIGNNSLVRELCLTGRNLYADEAFQCGLVNKVLSSQSELVEEALKTAAVIASKSPVAILGTKHLLNYSRDHSVAEGLKYTVTWNSAMLNTEDIPLSIQASQAKQAATFSKL